MPPAAPAVGAGAGCATASAVAGGLASAATVASGVAKMVSKPQAPMAPTPTPLTKDQSAVSQGLAQSFASPSVKTGPLGGGMGMTNTADIKSRLGMIGQSLDQRLGAPAPAASPTPPQVL